MFERRIVPEAVFHVIRTGEPLQFYPDDQPYPSWLILGYWGGQAIHIVLARDAESGVCWVVTAYLPDPALWSDDFRRRKTS